MDGRKVLIVGLCCLDILNYVNNYPNEDSDNNVFESKICLGGNATNSVIVFNQLSNQYTNINCELFASIPANNKFIDELIKKSNININKNSPKHENCECPVSTVNIFIILILIKKVIINKNNGSRTILHYRGNLPELTFEEFYNAFGQQIKNKELDWIHFEGWNDMESAINGIQITMGESNKTIICAWGEKGASARQSFTNNSLIPPLYIQPIFTPLPSSVIDTLGAGDCFIGTALFNLCQNKKLKEVLAEAVRISGIKCTRKGLLNLNDLSNKNE